MRIRVSSPRHDRPAPVRELLERTLAALVDGSGPSVSLRASLERLRAEHRVEVVASVGRRLVPVARSSEGAWKAAVDRCLTRLRRRTGRIRARRRPVCRRPPH